MANNEDAPRRTLAHQIGEKLDALSVHEFEERIALLRTEIERLEAAKRLKQAARDAAGAVFGGPRQAP